MNERDVWLMDQRINDRGFAVDLDLAHAAIAAVQDEKKRWDETVNRLSEGAVTSATQRDRILKLLQERGVVADDLKADTVSELLARSGTDRELSGEARTLLEARQAVSKTSTAKYQRVVDAVSSDGRLRGVFQYCGAGRTGRWAGRGFQPHNQPRTPFDGDELERAVESIKTGAAPLIYDNIGELASQVIRGVVVAPPGRKLAVADYDAIEARLVAWIAGEQWKIDTHWRGEDIYKATFAELMGMVIDQVTKDQRRQGKVFELGLGYQGGVGALIRMAETYDVDLVNLARQAERIASRDVHGYAEWMLDLTKRNDMPRFGLSDRMYMGLEMAKKLWRDASPKTTDLWDALQSAAFKAITHKGKKVKAGRCVFLAKSHYLMIRLPSGRVMFYPHFRVTGDGDMSYALPYGGRTHTYGGKLLENCIAEGTEVLTDSGWKPIECVSRHDKVHDGSEFVSHGGLLYKGVQTCGSVDGVSMTPDHEVLTDEGWKTASQNPDPYRPEIRVFESPRPQSQRWKKVVVGLSMRLWETVQKSRLRVEERPPAWPTLELRLHDWAADRQSQPSPRAVSPSYLPCLAINASPVLQSQSLCLPQLWRAWDISLRALASIREFCGRYARFILARADDRTDRQQSGVQPGELSVGEPSRSSQQYSQYSENRNPVGSDFSQRSVSQERYWSHDTALPSRTWMASRSAFQETGFQKQAVYDLLNAGPLHRFVVRGQTGPFIVHNCCQAVGRDLLAYGMGQAEARDLPIVLHVHDEAAAEVSANEADTEPLEQALCTKPTWAEGLALSASGYIANRYRKE